MLSAAAAGSTVWPGQKNSTLDVQVVPVCE